MAYVYILY